MDVIGTHLIVLVFAIAAVAFLYSSVGHGGASGYLAVLSLLALPPALMSSTALMLNILVAGTGVAMFARERLVPVRFTLLFLIGSIPASFIGGLLTIPQRGYFLLLGAALIAASLRLLFLPTLLAPKEGEDHPPALAAVAIGGAIGLLSGMLGIGGGIFLSPIILFFRWNDARHTAAASALFIVVNSIAGLAGRAASGSLETAMMLPLLAAAWIGGMGGSYFGSKRFSNLMLQKILGGVLLLAALKLIIQHF